MGHTDIDVNYVANLARMQITPQEAAMFQGQLEQVLEHVRSLEHLDLAGVEPTAHAVPVHNVFREDVAVPGTLHDAAMANAPLSRDGLFIVPRILE
jgi:aspartyl-tRNA(Asn)/glutamyl-tRNA(Gln) amidotransferase subunit C